MLSKAEIRKESLYKRNSLTNIEITNFSLIIQKKLIDLIELKKINNLHIYMNFNSEVQTDIILQQVLSKNMIVGCMKLIDKSEFSHVLINQHTTFKKNKYGISEPEDNLNYDIGKCQLVIVPVVSFDTECNRIGYGGGYYDKFLTDKKLNTEIIKIGLAFGCQLENKINVEKHDISLDLVFTEGKDYKKNY